MRSSGFRKLNYMVRRALETTVLKKPVALGVAEARCHRWGAGGSPPGEILPEIDLVGVWFPPREITELQSEDPKSRERSCSLSSLHYFEMSGCAKVNKWLKIFKVK